MTSHLILTFAAILALSACANDMPAAEPGVGITGDAQIGVVVGNEPAAVVVN